MIYDAGQLNKKINIVGRVTKEVNGFDKTVTELKYKTYQQVLNLVADANTTKLNKYRMRKMSLL